MKTTGHRSKLLLSLAVATALSFGTTGCGDKSMESRLEAARQYADAKDLEAAIIEYKNAIQENPQASQPRFELGKLYLASGDFASAEKELNRALEMGQPASDVLPALSEAYQRTGAQNALSAVDIDIENMTPTEAAKVGYYKIEALAQLGKTDEARALVDQLASLDTKSVYKGLLTSYGPILDEEFAVALEQTLALKDQAPQNRDVLMQIARLQMVTDDLDAAVATYKEYVALNPDDITSTFALTSLLVENRQLDEAEPYVDELLKRNGKHGLLNQYKGIIEASQGNYEVALQHLETAIQNGRNDAAVRLVAGYSAYQTRDFKAAVRHFSMIASQLPDNHPGLRMLADSMLQVGDSEEASDILERVEGGLDSDASLFSKAGFQLLREGNVVEAQKMVERSSELSDSPAELARLGILQLSLNDVDGLVNLEEAAKQAPDSAMTQRTLLAAYVATNQLDKATEMATQWANDKPDDPTPAIFLAEIAMKQGETQKAREALDKAGAKDPKNTEVRFARAKLNLIEEKPEKATQELEAILSQQPANSRALTMLYSIKDKAGDPRPVVARVKKQLDAKPDQVGLRVLLAKMQYVGKKYGEVIETLKPIKGTKDTPLDYWQIKGQALVKQGQLKPATDHFSRWLEIYPLDKNALLGTLLIYDAEGKFDAALERANAFLAKRPDTQVSILKAYFLALKRNASEAQKILNKLPENMQALPFVKGVQARIDLQNNDAESALANIKVAYDAMPNPQNMILMVASYEMQGKSDEAFAFLKKHVQQYPEDDRARMLYAERLISTDRKEALYSYERILDRNPNNFVVLNNLAFLHFENGNMEKALPLAQKAVELQPKNPDAVDTLAQIRVKQGNPQQALTLYETLPLDNIRNDLVYANYIEALARMNKKELATRRMYDRQWRSDEAKAKLDKIKKEYKL